MVRRSASLPVTALELHLLMVQYQSIMEVNIFLSIVNSLSIPERFCPPASPFRRNFMCMGWGGRQEVRTVEFT